MGEEVTVGKRVDLRVAAPSMDELAASAAEPRLKTMSERRVEVIACLRTLAMAF